MRYLNKVILINSATVKYAEVPLGGNVHFTGTQGVGKSTLLRAILFFYNADTQKLGIKSGQKSFYEYYFPTQNSYVIYEIAKETGMYSVLCYRNSGKVCYRFIDGEYQPNYYIGENKSAFGSWEEIKAQLNKNGIHASIKVDRYEEYRDILYGNNNVGKEMKKFAMLESRQYQNIPRTIQNVLLNAELKAEFIKQTVIKSLNDEDIEVSLRDYKHHLSKFETQLHDIKIWTTKNSNGEIPVKKEAAQIQKLSLNIKHIDREKITLAKQLAYSVDQAQKQLPASRDTLATRENKQAVLVKKIEEAEGKFQEKKQKIVSEKSLYETRLKEAKEKTLYYENISIETVMDRVSKKKPITLELENLYKEKQILSSQFAEVTQRFDSLLREIDNQRKDFDNIQKDKRNSIHAGFLQMKDEANKQFAKLLVEIRNTHKESLNQAKALLQEKKDLVQDLKIKKSELKYQRFFDKEIEATKAQIQELGNKKQHAQNEVAHLQNLIKTLQTQWEAEEKSKKETTDRQTEKQTEQIEKHKAAIEEVDFKIANNKSSFYGWLNDNHKGWQNTIGKVCSDEVLFQSGLSPEIAATINDAFFGVKIDLSEITKKVKTIADYDKDKKNHQKEIEALQQKIAADHASLQDDLDKLRKKYQPKTKEYKDSINEHGYQLQQNTTKQENQQILLNDFLRKATDEKQASLLKIEEEISFAVADELQAQNDLARLETSIEKQEKVKEKEKDNRIKEEEAAMNALFASIAEELTHASANFDKRVADVKEQQEQELQGKGADTNRLNQIDQRVASIRTELRFIDENNDKVVEYKKDKRELLDRVEDFKSQKQLLEDKLENEQQKHLLQKEKNNAELKESKDLINQNKKEVETLENNINEFEEFTATDIYKNLAGLYREAKAESQTDRDCKSIIKELYQLETQGRKRLDEIKEAITQFLGNFSENNIFKFKTTLSSTQEHLDFADMLTEFVEENKISQYEKEVNERFAYIIHSVGKETGNLMSRGGEIQKTIHKINKDFEERNFVGAIKKIELRFVESTNKIVTLLLRIKQFNDENVYGLGTANLFSSLDQDKQNKQAVDLLKALQKAINDSKLDAVNLADSFELQFRVIENQNDTGWVEKLANVGSEGTDILVKAMINIMLLNVSKSESSKGFKDFKLHCMMDEIGKLHPNNVRGILKFANERNILLINGSPTETNALDYKYIYTLKKDDKSVTKITRLITNYAQS